MEFPSEEMIASVVSEFEQHTATQHDKEEQCDSCRFSDYLDKLMNKTGQTTNLDKQIATLISHLEISDLIVNSGATKDLLDIARFAFVIGLKVGRNQLQSETMPLPKS